MKKICLFLPSLRGGGAERVMLTLANGIAEKGYIVDLVLAKAEGPYLKDVSPKVNVIDLDASRMLLSLLPFAKYLKKEKPDSILSAMRHVNIIAFLAKSLSGSKARLVFSEHNNLSTSSSVNKSHKTILLKSLMSWAYKKADVIVAVSNGVADDLAEQINLPRPGIVTIYNPVVTSHLLELKEEPLNHPWIQNDIPFIIGVGRLTAQKNFALLIDAFNQLQKKYDVNLVVLGEGELEEELKTQIEHLGLEDRVLMPGFVDNPYAWIKASKCFVLSSLHEGLPTVLIEAMACGTPVVSTDCPSGPFEILERGKWGKLVPVKNQDALVHAIAESLTSDIDTKSLEKRAKQFNTENSLIQYLEVL